MATLKQIQASRANGAKSKGPVTPQGKRNSSRNSIRHGILADTIVLEAEHRGPFLELVESLFQEHQPQTPTEIMMVDSIAVARWRQDRIWAMQKVSFDHDTDAGDPAASAPLRAVLTLRSSPDSMRAHELLLRYEVSFDRQISRSLHRLLQLQQKRLSPPPPASAPAIRTHQPLEKKPASIPSSGRGSARHGSARRGAAIPGGKPVFGPAYPETQTAPSPLPPPTQPLGKAGESLESLKK